MTPCSGTSHFCVKNRKTPKQDNHLCWIVLNWNDQIDLFLPMDKKKLLVLRKKVKEVKNKKINK